MLVNEFGLVDRGIALFPRFNFLHQFKPPYFFDVSRSLKQLTVISRTTVVNLDEE